MTNPNNLIKISGLTYIILALFLISLVPTLAGILLVLGVILLANSFISTKELAKKRAVLLFIAIISFILNILAAILLLIAFESITSTKQDMTNSPPKATVSADSKKIDILLKVGLAMVLIAGLLFATTTWHFITDTIKIISLISMGLLFLGLSVFSEAKLKLEKTTKAYFILGLAFLILTFIGVGYFAPFSTWFSYIGEGRSLVYALTYLLIAISFYLVNYKFHDQECLYLGHAILYLTIYSILRFANLSKEVAILIMTALTFLLNITTKEKKTSLQKFNATTTYLYFPLIIIESFSAFFPILLVTTLINIADLLVSSTKNQLPEEGVITTIISYLLILFTIGQLPYDVEAFVTIFITLTIFVYLIRLTPLSKNNYLNISSQILYHLTSLVIIIYYLIMPSIEGILVTSIYLILNILGSLDFFETKTDHSLKLDFYYQPLVILYFISSLVGYFYENIYEINLVFIPIICGLIYITINYFSKKDQVKKYYLVFAGIASALSLLINTAVLNIIAGIVIILEGIYLYFSSHKLDTQICSYIFIIINVYILTIALLPTIYANVLAFLVFGLLTLIIKDKKQSLINQLAIIIPLISTIYSTGYNYYTYQLIAINYLQLYVIFLLLKYLVKPKTTKDLLAAIFYALFNATIIFKGILEIGIYIGLLSIIIIFVTIMDEDYKKLFYTSIIILVVNILVQLWQFWGILPFWLYLLLAGLSIIAFVTTKEINKDKKPLPIKPQMQEVPIPKTASQLRDQIILAEPVEVENKPLKDIKSTKTTSQEKKLVGNFCPICGTKNIKLGNYCKTCGHNLIIKK